jgi:uncharacterized protein
MTDWVTTLQLQPHPEGGYFRETYRANEGIQLADLPERFWVGTAEAQESNAGGVRQFSTAIYYLLPYGHFSSLHRIKSDEVWHFYAGSCLSVYAIDTQGQLSVLKLGGHPEQREVFQGVVKAGCWFGARVEVPDTYALVGCTVAPGFDFADFELAERQKLLQQFPQHQELILQLTRDGG